MFDLTQKLCGKKQPDQDNGRGQKSPAAHHHGMPPNPLKRQICCGQC